MRNIGMLLEYLGTNYAGYQKQTNQKTVQGVLEDTLSTILREKITTIAAGRTDAGVHAYGQVVNFRTTLDIDLKKLQWSANCILPKDISIKDIFEAVETFNARRDAISREYIYQVVNRPYKSAFLGEISLFYPWKLNFSSMEKASRQFMSTYDFSAFAHIEKDDRVSKVKTIYSVKLTKKDGLIVISIVADSFLHHMVRIIVGSLLDVGSGKLKPGNIQYIIDSKDRAKAGETAPSHGLILKTVSYPDDIKKAEAL